MGSLLHLESFDAETDFRVDQTAPPATYEDGYAAGLAAAEANMADAQDMLRQDLVQSITDAAFGYHEAQAHLLDSVTALLEAMLSAILPAALAPAFFAHIQDMVSQALATDAAAPISLNVPADQVAAVTDALRDLETSHLTITADPKLSEHAAWVTVPDRETALDLDATLKAITDQVALLLGPTTSSLKSEAS